MAALAAIAISFALSYTKAIMVPFVFSLFLYFMLLPFLRFLKNEVRLPRWLALVITFTLVFVIVLVLTLIAVAFVRGFLDGYQDYYNRLVIALEKGRRYLVEQGFTMAQEFDAPSYLSRLPLLNIIRNAGFGALNFISSLSLVFIFLLFLFIGTAAAETPTDSESSNVDVDDVSGNEFLMEVDYKIRQYLLVKLTTSLITAIVIGTFFMFMGLDFALTFATAVFVLNFIPTIGSIVATILPVPIALIQYDSSLMVWLIVIIPGLTQFIIGSVIEPKIMGDSLKIHPVVILLSLMFWALIWGIPGAFMAVPLTAAIKIILEKIEGGHYISQLMSGDITRKK
ncbi:MAG: AI-2E family transporter [Bdellovibrionaceae bacterium]|nr:AI-2E family transporter [Pseudobdellovibrionaceae bacterium]